MPNFLEMLRMANIFNPQTVGNDMPSQGGISGRMGQMGQGGNIFSQIGDIFVPKRPSPFETLNMGGQPTPTQSPLPSPAMPSPTTTSSMNPADSVAQRMKELYQPSEEATNKFNELIGGYPQMDEYKPSWLRRIGAMLTAFGPGGQEAGMEFMNRPYTEKLTDWKNTIGPAQQAANLERQENVNSRTLAYQTVAQQLRAEADAERANNNERNAQIRQQRADVYEFKAKNPNMRFDFTGPTVMVANPQTGQVTNTGIPTGSLSDADKMTLGQENALERIGATGEQQRQTETLRQTGREGLAETRGWQVYNVPDPANPGQMKAVKINQITGDVQDISTGPVSRPTTGAGITGAKGELPTQTKVRQFNAAKQLANTNPELAKFIKFTGGANEFAITPPSTGGFFGPSGPTPEQYRMIQQAIYGNELPISQPGRTGAPTTPTKPTAASPAPTGKVLVLSPDGRRGYVPQGQLQSALAQGYKQVQ